MWRDLGSGVPDGICIDADNAVWYGDVSNKRCGHVREEGEVPQTVELERAASLECPGVRTTERLFVVATELRGMENIAEVARARTRQRLTVEAPAAGSGWAQEQGAG